MTATINIDRPGQPTLCVARGLTQERAYELALAIRPEILPGETLWTGDADEQTVVHRCEATA